MITVEAINTSNSGVIEIEVYFDKKGLNKLLEELKRLNMPGDHAHLKTPSWAGYELEEQHYAENSTIINHVKLILIGDEYVK